MYLDPLLSYRSVKTHNILYCIKYYLYTPPLYIDIINIYFYCKNGILF